MHRKKTAGRMSFFRYAVLYVLFAAILFISYVPIYGYIATTTRDSLLEQHGHVLQSNAGVLDGAIDALNNAVVVTYNDRRFRQFRYLNVAQRSAEELNRIDFNALKDLLNGLVMSHDLIADTAILFTDEIVLTRQRSFFSSTYYAYYPQFLSADGWQFDQWKAALAGANLFLPAMPYTSRDYGTYEAITFTRPWSDQANSHGNTFIATLPARRLYDLFVETSLSSEAYLRIADSNNTTLYEYGANNLPGCHKLSVKTDKWQMNIDVGVPLTLLDEGTASVRQITMVFFVVMTVVTLLLILFFSYRSAMPIRNILSIVSESLHLRKSYEMLPEDEKKRARLLREYRMLGRSLTEIDDKLEQYMRVIDRQQSRLQMQLMDMALRSGLYRPEQLELFAATFPDFPARYRLALLTYETLGYETLDDTMQAQLDITGLLQDALGTVYIQGLDGTMILLLLPEGEGEALDWEAGMQALVRDLSMSFDMRFSIALSQTYTKAQDLPRAYQQVQHQGVGRPGLLGSDTAAQGQRQQLPLGIGSLQILHSALSNGNLHVAVNTLAECLDALPEKEDYMLYKHTYTMIANLLIQLKLEHPNTLFEIVVPLFDAVRKREAFERQFTECFTHVCNSMLMARSQPTDDFATQVMAFIDAELSNPDLCVGMVADRFSISAPTLQKIVKGMTEQTFSAYVEDKRLQKAYLLLTQGEDSVQAVATRCGFSSSNSFYKVFRRRYGLSPSAVQPDGNDASKPRSDGHREN